MSATEHKFASGSVRGCSSELADEFTDMSMVVSDQYCDQRNSTTDIVTLFLQCAFLLVVKITFLHLRQQFCCLLIHC